jgi:hypothetical protein
MSEEMIGIPGALMAQRTSEAIRREVRGPFEKLGFKKIEYSWNGDKQMLYFNIDERVRPTVTHWIQGLIDPAGNGVVIGTIELVPRGNDQYGGANEMGNLRGQVPEAVVTDAWNEAVAKGRDRWKLIKTTAPADLGSAPLVSAERQNELIYALLQLAVDVLDVRIRPLKYVCHQHVSSPDGNRVMIYGRTKRNWMSDVTYTVSDAEPEDSFLALLGVSNAGFVQKLIEQFGTRLGISRLASISVCMNGLNVHWNFA